jgi:integrase
LRVTDLAGALKGFWDFLVVDQNLAERTAKRYYSIINRVLSQSGELTTNALRSILKSVENPNTRANYVKAFRVFFKRYLGLNIADGFKIPQPTPKPIKVPPKEDLQAFFYALPSLQSKTAFLLWATTGRRRDEVLTLTLSDINIDERLIIRRVERGETKKEWVSVFNFEAQEYLRQYLNTNPNPNRLFSYKHIRSAFKEAEEATGVKVTPQILREWFCNEMANLGVPDRYIDAFCGRTPKTILAKHYTEYTPQRLKKIYDQANLRVLT